MRYINGRKIVVGSPKFLDPIYKANSYKEWKGLSKIAATT